MEDIEHYDIPVYNFPYDVEEDDEETIQDNSELRVGQAFFWEMLNLNDCLGASAFRHHRVRGRN
jgi:hypothetical protein